MKATRILLITVILLSGIRLSGQADSTQIKINQRLKAIEAELKTNPILKKGYEDLTFYYTQVFKNISDSQKLQGFKINGYVDVYYARYSDKLPVGSYQKFPTSAPVSNSMALNLAQFTMSYQAEKVRTVATLHTGDIAASAWSRQYNFIQEAYLGIKLHKILWVDAGFFRTHLGLESIQPRENIGSSIALTTYFEPYFLSGAKLTAYINKKVNIQAGVFNGFNTFVAINSKKAVSASLNYEITPKLIASLNLLYSDNAADSVLSQRRLYNNFYIAYKSKRLNIGFEANAGIQEHSGLFDSTKTATMFSTLLSVKYKSRNGRKALYARGEIFNDRNEILTGPVINANHQFVGIHASGLTAGLEYKPVTDSFIRLESRYLHLWHDESIFYTYGTYTNKRLEFILSMGVWF